MLKPLPLIIALICVLNFFTINSNAQTIGNDPIIYQPNPDSPILERNPALRGEGEVFDFLIGDWDVVITWQPKNGEPNTYRAKWHNHWVVDGRVVMQEWRGPTLTGAEFRFYDIDSKSWTGRNIYADGDWRETIAKSEGENLVVTIFGHNEATGDFLNRETYYNINENSFEMKSDISLDEGKSWTKGNYQMIVKRTIDK